MNLDKHYISYMFSSSRYCRGNGTFEWYGKPTR